MELTPRQLLVSARLPVDTRAALPPGLGNIMFDLITMSECRLCAWDSLAKLGSIKATSRPGVVSRYDVVTLSPSPLHIAGAVTERVIALPISYLDTQV